MHPTIPKRPSPQVPHYRPAPMGKRIVAMIIDIFISVTLTQMSSSFISKYLVQNIFYATAVSLVAGVVISCLYWMYLPVHYNGTPGKRLMGLRIVTDKYSREITGAMMFKREGVGKFLSAIVLGFGYLAAFIDTKEHKAWHDRMANTRVIEDT